MINPTKDDIGRSVVYNGNYNRVKEYGVITSFNDKFVFVRYSTQHASQGGIATLRKDLEYEN